jgi:pimeloyl-ACP methyl ester carboxylesterase
MTYPRTLDWSLEKYAGEIAAHLKSQNIHAGWLLGESFGSQIVWPLAALDELKINGVILAGGFGPHPLRLAVRAMDQILGRISLNLLTNILFGYARLARYRARNSPEALARLNEFLARRTELDRQAARHRLRLISKNNPIAHAQKISVPIYALTGGFDPVVPWLSARTWLRKNCATLKEYKVIRQSDHNVLNNASQAAADQVVAWIQSHDPPK